MIFLKKSYSPPSSSPEEVQDSVIHSIQESTTQWFDTHPADSDRITNALREETEGVFQVELPSSILFSDFESQAKATTWEFYREQFDNKVDRSQLVPIDKIIERQDYREASEMALDRFFQGVLAVTLPFPIRFAHSPAF